MTGPGTPSDPEVRVTVTRSSAGADVLVGSQSRNWAMPWSVWAREHRRAARGLQMVAAAAAALLLLVTRSQPSAGPRTTAVTSLSLTSEESPDGRPDLLHVTWQVDVGLHIGGVRGPGVADVTPGPVAVEPSAGRSVGQRVQQVSIRPDCAHVAVLNGGGAYRVLLQDQAGVRVEAPTGDGPVDLPAALRAACWRDVGRHLRVVSLSAQPDSATGGVLEQVLLVNDGAVPVRVEAVDVSDVNTLPAADAVDLRVGDQRTLTFRTPVRACPAAGSALATLSEVPVSVGPAAAPPAGTATLHLGRPQLALLVAAVTQACGHPPGLSVRFRSATVRVRTPGEATADRTLDLVLDLVSSGVERVDVGDDPTALTADARVLFSAAGRTGSSVVRTQWHLRCTPAGLTPPLLPVRTTSTEGRTYDISRALRDAELAQVVARSCNVPLAGLVHRGWRGTGP